MIRLAHLANVLCEFTSLKRGRNLTKHSARIDMDRNISRRKRIAFSLAVALAVVAASSVAGEVTVRVLYPQRIVPRYVEDDETYSAVLEGMLRRDGIDAEVINMGIPGFGTALFIVDLADKSWASCFPPDLRHDGRTRILSTWEAFRRSLEQGRNPFYKVDGHPNAEGHRVIAACIYESLQREWANGTLPRK